jgi:hypothetical protein
MISYGLRADTQTFADGLRGEILGDELHDLSLTGSEASSVSGGAIRFDVVPAFYSEAKDQALASRTSVTRCIDGSTGVGIKRLASADAYRI